MGNTIKREYIMDSFNVSGIPVTYQPQKAKKVKLDKSNLYKVDMLGFNQNIGRITNTGSTIPEMQSLYDVGSKEWLELETRWKLCCKLQSVEIDSQKGLEKKPIFKHWLNYERISDDMKNSLSQEEINEIAFRNKLIIEKRPYFMRYLYSSYNKEYKNNINDFDKYCLIKLGKKFSELTEDDKKTDLGKSIVEYYNKKNPLLETNGVMNRICRYMESQLKEIKSITKCDNNEMLFNKLYNTNIELDESKLELMLVKKKEYEDFKKSKQLKDSEFSNYEQYYKFLKNDCLEKISSNLQELANLAVYICYKLNPTKQKNFCWDVFGSGIVDNLKEKNKIANVPVKDDNGDIEYLYDKYSIVGIDVSCETPDNEVSDFIANDIENCDFNLTDDDFNMDFDIEDSME